MIPPNIIVIHLLLQIYDIKILSDFVVYMKMFCHKRLSYMRTKYLKVRF